MGRQQDRHFTPRTSKRTHSCLQRLNISRNLNKWRGLVLKLLWSFPYCHLLLLLPEKAYCRIAKKSAAWPSLRFRTQHLSERLSKSSRPNGNCEKTQTRRYCQWLNKDLGLSPLEMQWHGFVVFYHKLTPHFFPAVLRQYCYIDFKTCKGTQLQQCNTGWHLR